MAVIIDHGTAVLDFRRTVAASRSESAGEFPDHESNLERKNDFTQ
jgi:hypothetical protein